MEKRDEERGEVIAYLDMAYIKKNFKKRSIIIIMMGFLFNIIGFFLAYFYVFDPALRNSENFDPYTNFILFWMGIFLFSVGFLFYYVAIMKLRMAQPVIVYEKGIYAANKPLRELKFNAGEFISFFSIFEIFSNDGILTTQLKDGSKRAIFLGYPKEANLIEKAFEHSKSSSSYNKKSYYDKIYFDRDKFEFSNNNVLRFECKHYGDGIQMALVGLFLIAYGSYYIITRDLFNNFQFNMIDSCFAGFVPLGIFVLVVMKIELKDIVLHMNNEGIRLIYDHDITLSEAWKDIEKVGGVINADSTPGEIELTVKGNNIPLSITFRKWSVHKEIYRKIKEYAKKNNIKIDERIEQD